MNFFEQWVELDLNPIISFSSAGKIIYSNNEAQFVLSRIPQKQLFDIALKYAPTTFGEKTSYVDLSIKNYIFYAITIFYENDEEITLKLYKSTMVKKHTNMNPTNGNISNIFTIVDLCISTQKTKNKISFIKNYDPSIPEFKIVASKLIKLLNEIYSSFEDINSITTSIKLKIGEYIKIDSIKYSLVSLEINCDKEEGYDFSNIENNNLYSTFIVSSDFNKITIDLPLIKK